MDKRLFKDFRKNWIYCSLSQDSEFTYSEREKAMKKMYGNYRNYFSKLDSLSVIKRLHLLSYLRGESVDEIESQIYSDFNA